MVLSFEDWKKVELKVGLIEVVDDISGKDKLYKMTVDFASEKRTILAGLKPFYPPGWLQGKKAIFVFNLAPRAMAGIESQGMILAMRDSEGMYRVAFVDDAIPQGTQLE